jgi:hemimethylated DNA binding protein
MEQFELNQQSPANFVKSVMATEWQQLIEENYIAEPHIVQEHMFVGDTSKEEDQHHIIVQRNIEVGFSMLRKANRHVDYVESLRESGFFEPKTRLTTEEKERKKERKEKSGVAKVVSKSLKLQYCVGQSLVHRLFGNCVVTGWDKECEASDDWCKSNRIDQRLKHGRHQPFYNVLCEDGEYRYCSQENLTVRDAKDCLSPINHQAVGYFFIDYNVGTGLHVMNDDLRMRYPDDMELNDIAMISYHNKKKEVEEELGNMKKPMSEVDDNPDVRGSALEGVKDDDIKSEDSLHTAREAVTNFINLRKDR